MKVVYLARTLPHYRLAILRELRRRGVDLSVVTFSDSSAEYGVVPTLGTDPESGIPVMNVEGGGWGPGIARRCEALGAQIVVVEHGASLGFTWSVLFSGRRGSTTRVLWSHGVANRERHTRRWDWGSLGRWIQLAVADGILCYDREMAANLARRFPEKAVGTAPNSTDGGPLLAAHDVLVREGKEAVKSRRHLDCSCYLVAIGRLVAGKEFHRLPGILSVVRKVLPDVGLIIIGGGPERGRIRDAITSHGFVEGQDVVLPGAVVDPMDLATWLYCSDVFINPGYVGLNAVDALFAGLPTVLAYPSPAGPYHSPEWFYLRDSAAGLFVDSNDDVSFAGKIVEHLSLSSDARAEMQARWRRYAVENLGTGPMADGFLELLGRLQGGGYGRSPS